MKKGKKIVKKIILIFICVLIASVFAGIIVLKATGRITFANGKLNIDLTKELSTKNEKLQAINEAGTSDIFYFGEKHEFTWDIGVTYIDALKEEKTVSGNRYALLVVDDMYDRIELKDADYEFLYNWVYEKKNALLFIGVSKVKELNKHGFTLKEMDSMFTGTLLYYSTGRNTVRKIYGAWDLQAQNTYDNKRKDVLDEYIVEALMEVILEK